MSWHYLQGQEEVSSEGISWDGDAFAPSKSKTTLGEYSLPDNETECCPSSPSGTTCAPSTVNPGEGESMSSAADFPARTSAQPAREQASQARDLGYGTRWRELSVKFDRATSSWRTHLCLWVEDLPWSSVTLPRWGMMLGGVCWEQETPAHLTGGIESGFSLPTPCKNEGRGSSSKRYIGSRHYRGAKTSEALRTCESDPQYLHPRFAEWLMGWPLGWTDLKPLETDKFHNAPPWHGKF